MGSKSASLCLSFFFSIFLLDFKTNHNRSWSMWTDCFSGELFPEPGWNAGSRSGLDQVTNEQSFYLNASIFQWSLPSATASLCPRLWP